MKHATKKILACLLVFSMVFSMTVGVSAADATDTNDTAHKLDRVFDTVLDGALGLVGRIFTAKDIPTVEEYNLNSNEYFYEGTNGTVSSDSWKLGFSSTSVIPSQWRRNADGEADPQEAFQN